MFRMRATWKKMRNGKYEWTSNEKIRGAKMAPGRGKFPIAAPASAERARKMWRMRRLIRKGSA